MNDNLFAPDNGAPRVDPDKDYYSELVGDGKKFKDEKALARAKYEADLTIENFKKDKDEMRADIIAMQEREKSRATIEQLLERLEKAQNNTTSDPPSAEPVSNVPTPKPEEIKSLFKQAYEEEKQKEKETSNFNIVQAKLRDRFGANAQNALNEQREVLGLTIEEVNALAKRSPEAFFRTFNLNAPQQQQDEFTSLPRNTQRSDSFAPRTEKRTWSWYQNLKKTNPASYWDPKMVAQRHKDALSLGEEFNDGDANYWDRLGNPLYSP